MVHWKFNILGSMITLNPRNISMAVIWMPKWYEWNKNGAKLKIHSIFVCTDALFLTQIIIKTISAIEINRKYKYHLQITHTFYSVASFALDTLQRQQINGWNIKVFFNRFLDNCIQYCDQCELFWFEFEIQRIKKKSPCHTRFWFFKRNQWNCNFIAKRSTMFVGIQCN